MPARAKSLDTSQSQLNLLGLTAKLEIAALPGCSLGETFIEEPG